MQVQILAIKTVTSVLVLEGLIKSLALVAMLMDQPNINMPNFNIALTLCA